MQPQFREDKTTQMACMVLRLGDGTLTYLKLNKLLYLIDREALIRWGRPISFDHYVSMNEGPVLSRTYDLIKNVVPPTIDSYWRRFIGPAANYSVQLLEEVDCPEDDLSEAERDLIHEVFRDHGHRNRWELVELTHRLPEWQDPGGSAIPIEYHDILIRGAKMTELEARAIEDELEALALADRIFG